MNQIRDTKQEEYWNNRAKSYSKQYGLDTEFNKLKVQRKINIVQQYIDLTGKLLEVGCGTGIYTRELSKINSSLIAVDISQKMLNIAATQCLLPEFLQMDARKMNLPNNSFDIVFSAFLLQHVHIYPVLSEMNRVLKTNGYIVALVPNILNPIHYGRARNILYRKVFRETSHSLDFTRWQWSAILEATGFKEIVIKPISFDSPHIPMFLAKSAMYISNILENVPIVKEFAGTLLIIGQKI